MTPRQRAHQALNGATLKLAESDDFAAAVSLVETEIIAAIEAERQACARIAHDRVTSLNTVTLDGDWDPDEDGEHQAAIAEAELIEDLIRARSK